MAEDPKSAHDPKPAPLPSATAVGQEPLPPLPASAYPSGAIELPDPTLKRRRVKTLVTVGIALAVTVCTALNIPICSIAQSWGVELTGCPAAAAPVAPAPAAPTP